MKSEICGEYFQEMRRLRMWCYILWFWRQTEGIWPESGGGRERRDCIEGQVRHLERRWDTYREEKKADCPKFKTQF